MSMGVLTLIEKSVIEKKSNCSFGNDITIAQKYVSYLEYSWLSYAIRLSSMSNVEVKYALRFCTWHA